MLIGWPENLTRRCIALLLPLVVSACVHEEKIQDLDYHRGRNAMEMARYDWARFYFAADLEANPERRESLRGLGLGWISGYQGSLTHGVEALEKYLQLAPEDTETRLRLARSWLQSGERERARKVLDGLEESLESLLLLTRIQLAEDPETARPHLLKALQMAPETFEVHHLAARVYERLGEDAQALEHAQQAAQINPLSPELFYTTAQISRRMGDLAAAEEALTTYKLLRQLPSPGSPVPASQELPLLRQLEERLAPSSKAFKQRLCRLLLETGGVAEAAPLLEEIQSSSEVDLDSLLILAQTAHTQGRTSIARDLYQDVLGRKATHLKAIAQLGLLAYETHDYEAAQELLKQGLELDPNYAPLHYTTGLLALAQGEDERAVQALSAAVDLVPWLSRYRITLADVFLTQGDRASFDRLLAEVPASDPAVDAYRKKHAL